MNKLLSLLISLLYFFTAQLSVHAFTMHPPSHWWAEHHHEEKKPDCWHPQPTHDHDSHQDESEDHHGEHDMTMCFEQSVWVVIIDTADITDYNDDNNILPIVKCLTSEQDKIDQYFYSIHDPWRWDDWCFSDFLNNDLYGHWVIMHC